VSYGAALLLFVTAVWGTTFPIIRIASAHLSGVEISALRFLIAGLIMLPVALRASRAAWRDGIVLGAVALISHVSQAIGLQHISSNRSAFLTSLNVLMVPFLALWLGGRLSRQALAAAILACAGIGLMSWDGRGDPFGDGVTLLCALAYAVYIILLSRRIRSHSSLTLAATQLVSMALLGGAWLLAAHLRGESFAALAERAQPILTSVIYLGVVASAGMLLLQAIGQRQVSAQKAAVIYALEPVFAALAGWIWLHETLTAREQAGGAMVVVAVILGEWRFVLASKDKQ